MQTRRKVLLIAVAASLTVGIMLGVVLSSNLLVTRSLSSSANQKNQSLSISGTETIKVLAPNGQVVSTWHGPDPLSLTAINAIAACLVGQTGAYGVSVYGYCPSSGSTWIQQVEIDAGNSCTSSSYYSGGCVISDVTPTNTLTQNGEAGCDVSSSETTNYCNGWITEATFGPGTFTTSNCPTTCDLRNVQTQLNLGGHNGPGSATFDYLCTSKFATTFYDGTTLVPCTLTSPPATVSAGDSLLVTIQFTVS